MPIFARIHGPGRWLEALPFDSFELWLDGMNLITDCGAYLYTASREWRNRFRSTAFHNVVQIDDTELNRFLSPDNLWQLRDDARHDDHGADGDILKDHRHAFIFDFFGHLLGSWSEVMELVCWRYVHLKSVAPFKSSRNRLSAGYSVITRFKPAENKAS